MIERLTTRAIALLKQLIETQSFSSEEDKTATLIEQWFQDQNIVFRRTENNVWAMNKYYDESKPTLLLNSHHDTVKPNNGYTKDPFKAIVEDGKLYGLGSNDAGGCLVSLMATFAYFYNREHLKYNLVIVASAEEESSGDNGLNSMLKIIPKVDVAIVGEPTLMNLAVAEKGLVVFDAVVKGTASHAAHPNDDNAIYNTISVLDWFKNYKFKKTSDTLGEVKLTVTQINAGKQHNAVPADVQLVIDVRVNDKYSNQDIVDILQKEAPCDSIIPRSIKLNSSSIPNNHPLVVAGVKIGRSTYGSPTLSDQACLVCPSLKLGPGDSTRSHSADEFIYVSEIEEGIKIYIKLLEKYFKLEVMKLWDKGISIDKKIEQFTVGNDREIDMHIAKYDVQASLAHAIMLESIGIISSEELQQLKNGLKVIAETIENGTFVIEDSFEDVHSKIEHELTKTLGEVGKKIHTARSRNDQVLVALQLYYKESLKEINDKTKTFFDTLLSLADTHKDALLPGYTHLQVAMPSSFGLWFSAYAEVLIDDVFLLNASLKTVDQNPLGSAAGYGSSFPIDRNLTTKELGFSTLKYNVVAAQMSRGKSERTIALALGSICNTLARFAMDICLYNSQNFGFITFPDELTTGSSIMPHKKNPDVFELIRGKANKIQALHTEMVLITNNLPSGYHRDFQLLKENIIAAIEDVKDLLDIFNYAIQQVQVQYIDLNDSKYQYLFTVDNINTLVVEGMPFREAYQKIGGEVENGTYKPDKSKQHTHVGSIGNLCLNEIKEKYPK